MTNDPFSVLRRAVSDVGYWRWWTSDLPQAFQVEFGGALLRRSATDGTKSGSLVALEFTDLGSVAFLTRAPAEVLPDWPHRLAADTIDHFTLSYDQFALMDAARVHTIVAEAKRVDVYAGTDPRATDWQAVGVALGFWAGPVGLSVAAQSFTVKDVQGPIALAEIQSMHDAWWEYWRDYWRRLSSGDPLPKDYACEVTIPLKS